jgi:citrate lyase subunit beta/citryl-CoA lyase
MNNLLMRSLMFVPGHNDKLLRKAAVSESDVLLLDLEDSVQPYSNKAIARELIQSFTRDGLFSDKKIFPRVNDRESGELLKDIRALTIQGIDGFMYPKAKTGQDIYFIDKLLETIEYEKGLSVGTFKLIPLIETSAAVLNAQDICQASKRVVAIAYGCEDFISDLQGIHDNDEQSLFTPRAIIAMAARANNIIPIDTVHIKVHDLDDLEKNLKIAKNLGFEGMLILNPKEIPLVHQYFSPTSQEISDAKEILSLSKQAMDNNQGVAILNGKFIGPPMVLKAQQVLAKAGLAKKI